MAHFRIVPERSQVVVDAKSSLHPIHTSTTGLEGSLDMEVLGGGRINLQAPAKASLSFAGRQAVVGQPARGSRASAPHRLAPVPDHRRRAERATRDRARTGATSPAVTSRSGGRPTRTKTRSPFSRIDDRTLAIAGEHTFDIRDFGMDPPKILMFRVEPDVKVHVDLVAEQVD